MPHTLQHTGLEDQQQPFQSPFAPRPPRVALEEKVPTPPSTRFDTIRNRPVQVISPSLREYLTRQLRLMALNNASEEEQSHFLRMEGINTPEPSPQSIQDQVQNPVIVEIPSQVETPSQLRGLSMRALQGITWGFGDEAMGAVLGIMTGEGARGGIETYRREIEAFNEGNFGKGLTAEIFGGFLTGKGIIKLSQVVFGAGSRLARAAAGRAIGAVRGGARGAREGAAAAELSSNVLEAGRALQASSFGGRVGAAGKAGATGGVVFGAGNVEGDFTLEGLSDRAKSSLIGGTAGAALASGLSAGVAIISPVVKPVGRAVTKGLGNLRDLVPGINSPRTTAMDLTIRAMLQDGIDIDAAIIRAQQAQATGVPTVLADITGDATMRLARDAITLRSPLNTRLLELMVRRQGEQGERITGRLFQSLFRRNRFGLNNVDDVTAELHTAKLAASRPHYVEAFTQTVTITDRMRQIMSSSQFRNAYKVGRRISQQEDLAGIGHGLEVPLIPEVSGMGGVSAELTERLFPATLPIRGLDYMKRGLDNIIRQGIRQGRPTLDRRNAATLRSMLNEVLTEAESQVGAYKQARAIYKGFSEAEQAFLGGQTFLKELPRDVRRLLSVMSPDERDFYRLGAAQNIRDNVMSSATDPNIASKYFGGNLFNLKNNANLRIRELFPDSPEVAEDFMRMIAAEARISHTTARVATGGAKPAGPQVREQVAEGPVPQARASVGLVVFSALRGSLISIKEGFQREVSDELSLIFSRGFDKREALRTLLEGLRLAQGRLLKVRTGRTTRAAVIGAGVARVATSLN